MRIVMPSTPAITRTCPSIAQLVDAPSFDAPTSVDGIAECDPAMKVLVSAVANIQKIERHLLLIRSVIMDIIASEVAQAAAAPLDQREDVKNDVMSPNSKGVVVDEIETVSENNIVKEKREGSKAKDMSHVVVPQAANGSKSTGPSSDEKRERNAHRPCVAVRHPLPLVEDREDAHAALIEPSSEDVFNEDVQWPRPGVRATPPPSARLRIHAGGHIVRQRSRSLDSPQTLTVIKHSLHGLPAASADRMAVSGPVNRKTPETDRVPPPLPSTPPPTRLIQKATSGLNIRTRRRSKSASHKNTPRGLRNDAMTPPSQRSEDNSGNDQSAHS